MQPVEDDCEEVCIIDTILKEQANEQQVQDVLTVTPRKYPRIFIIILLYILGIN